MKPGETSRTWARTVHAGGRRRLFFASACCARSSRRRYDTPPTGRTRRIPSPKLTAVAAAPRMPPPCRSAGAAPTPRGRSPPRRGPPPSDARLHPAGAPQPGSPLGALVAPGLAPLAGPPLTRGWQAQRAPAGPGIRAAAHGRGRRRRGGGVLHRGGVQFAARLGPDRPQCGRPGSGTKASFQAAGASVAALYLAWPGAVADDQDQIRPAISFAVKAVLIAAGRTPDPYRGVAYPGGQGFLAAAPGPRLSCVTTRKAAWSVSRSWRPRRPGPRKTSTAWRRSARVSTPSCSRTTLPRTALRPPFTTEERIRSIRS